MEGDAKRRQGASSEVVRDINRRIVLNLVRTHQPISRADLARVSGMQRSTISLIIEQLIAENWVQEGPTARLPRGRRPTHLRLNDDRVIISVDIRPVQSTVALADANGKFTYHEVVSTTADSKVTLERIVDAIQRIRKLCRGKMIEGVGISVPGRYDPGRGRLVFAPNLRWPDVDLREQIERRTGLDVAVENAANACVLAELWFNRTEECRDLVVVTVSEGIGTGILANGQLVSGFNGMAGEFGHVTLDPKGPPCGCGRNGCWEAFASNRAALRYYSEGSAREPAPSFADLLNRADQGDPYAVQALEKMAHYLGWGMRMLVAGLAPERIIVVGDLTRSWRRFNAAIKAEIYAHTLPGATPPKLVPVYEDGTARLRGTVALVLQKHFAVPGERL
jgi:predicted NBD/HSP70 family sugar kinase